MGDMISRDAAIGALEDRRDKYQKDSQTWLQIQMDILAIRAIPAADARAEALKEAADAWAAYKAANTTVAHWEAVARLDAALIPETKP